MLNTIRYVLGDYAATMPAGALMVNRNEDHLAFAQLRGIRLACAAEMEDGKRFHESKIKELTGGDTIVARFLYQNFFEFKPQFKIFMAGNHKPTIRGNDHAMWRRVKLIPFLVTIPSKEQDRNLEEKLRAEAAGILNWALEGFKVWREDGLQTPPAVKNATAEYKSQMDTLGTWLSEYCCKDKSVKTSHKELFYYYKEWAEDNNEWQMTGKKFSQLLMERGFERVRLKSGVHFYGLRLK
jgi:putative DNA primase/helicase